MLKIISFKENKGYGYALNRGIEQSTGKYIGIVESDDFADPNMFNDLYDIAVKNNADIVKSDFYYYTGKNKQSRKAYNIAKNKYKKVFTIKDNTSILKLVPSIWSSIYKKSFLDKNGIRFLETAGASYQDTSFVFKALVTAERLIFTDKAYLYYRQDNENSSTKSREKVYCICNEWQEITRYINERPEIKEIVNQVKLSAQFAGYKWNTLRIDRKFREEFVNKYQETFKKYYENGEIKDEFYKTTKKEELVLLLTDKKKFLDFIESEKLKQERRHKRRQQFSIRINLSRIRIVLFGKQIMDVAHEDII